MKDLKEFFEENDFIVSVSEDGNAAEIETWTKGGVNMIFYLDPFTIEEFKDIVNDFDIDNEIELHREDPRYKADFTIKQSLKDFEDYHNRLKRVLSKLNKLIKEEIFTKNEFELYTGLNNLLSSYRADFKAITGAELNDTETVKQTKELLKKYKVK
jgi:hypothetical protein